MFKRRLNVTLLGILVVMSLILAACPAPQAGAPAAEAPAAEAPAAEAAPTEAPAEEAAPAGDDVRAQTVIFDIDGGKVADPTLWNPFVPGNRRDHGFHQAILEPLFMLNYQTGAIEPWLGESMTANDTQDEWTLKLRQGIEWSDGTPLTADDVTFTYNDILMVNEDLGDSAWVREWIASITKVDDLTVVFALNKPNPRFQLDYFSVKIWGGVSIMPKHIWEGQDPLTFKNYDAAAGQMPIGTGPYVLTGFNDDGTEFNYERNDNWWGAKTGWKPLPAPKYLKWIWAGPPETRAALMAENQIDSLMDITLGALQAIQAQNPNIIAWYSDLPKAWVPDPCSRTFEFNNTDPVWGDPEMRWAVNYVIDRDQIVEIAYEGSTFKSRHFFPAYPPLDAMVDAAIEAGAWNVDQLWTVDPAKAAEIVEGKGYTKNGNGYYEKDGQELTLDIVTHEAFIEKQRIAQVVVEQLQAFGINATTRNMAGSQWDEEFRKGNLQAKMGWQTCGSVNEPWASLDQFNVKWLVPVGERANGNGWRWQGPDAEAYSALVDEMGTLPLGDPKVQELFNEAMTIWFKNLPVIPVTQAKKIIPFNTTYWTGWPTADDDYIHPPTWWQHTHAIIHALKPAGQ